MNPTTTAFLTPTDRRDAAGEPTAYDLGAEALKSLAVAAVSGFEENLDNSVNHFQLLRVALREERINALPDVSWVFFPFQE
jgi:hypothetical protein